VLLQLWIPNPNAVYEHCSRSILNRFTLA